VAVSVNRAGNGDPPSDPDFEEIDIAEEELIDAYVRGELSADERKLIERGLRNSPELVERLHFARLLSGAADQALEADVPSDRSHEQLRSEPKRRWSFGLMPGPRPAFNLALAACALIIVVAGIGLLAGWLSLRRERQQLADQQAAVERQRLELQKSAAEQRVATDRISAQLKEEQQKREGDQQLIAALQQAQSQRSTAATVATLFLLPVSRGSDTHNELKPAAGVSRIKLQLGVESIDYASYLVEIKNSQGKQILQQNVGPPRSGKIVTVSIPKKALPAGTYTLQLNGISPEGTRELVGNYSFRIVASNRDN